VRHRDCCFKRGSNNWSEGKMKIRIIKWVFKMFVTAGFIGLGSYAAGFYFALGAYRAVDKSPIFYGDERTGERYAIAPFSGLVLIQKEQAK
jgi:hypothetical protein